MFGTANILHWVGQMKFDNLHSGNSAYSILNKALSRQSCFSRRYLEQQRQADAGFAFFNNEKEDMV